MDRTEDEGKLTEATNRISDGISEEEAKLIDLLRSFNIKPRLETPEELVNIVQALKGKKEDVSPMTSQVPLPEPAPRLGHHFPKLSTFYGEAGKEGNWDTFKYEVESLLGGSSFSDEQIMFGIQRAVKGSASDKLRWLGPGVTPRHVLDRLECDYGTVENKESALRKLYTCEQKSSESVESYATRLEELFYRSVELRAMNMSDRPTLKKILHSGLRHELKQMTVYQSDKIRDYDEFKMELRKIESEMKPVCNEKLTCKPAVTASKKEEENETTRLLKQVLERIDKLEQSQLQQPEEDQQQVHYGRGYGRGRWNRYHRGRGHNRGRGQYVPQRPEAGTTFAPTCFLCEKRGHIQINCPLITSQLICTACKEKGHIRAECPNC